MSGGTLSASNLICRYRRYRRVHPLRRNQHRLEWPLPRLQLGRHGNLRLSGTGRLSLYNEYVGYSGAGSFTQSGGTNGCESLALGYNSTGTGAYNLSAGTLSVTTQSVGFSATGSFTQSGGTNTNTSLYLGYNSAGNGTYNMTGGSLASIYQYVGCSGTGTFVQSGGTNTTGNGTLYLGSGPETNGTSRVGPGPWPHGTEYIGYNSTDRTFQQTGGSKPSPRSRSAAGDQYVLSGGTLDVTGSVANSGTVDGGNGRPRWRPIASRSHLGYVEELLQLDCQHGDQWTVGRTRRINVSTGLAGVTTAGLGVHVLGTTLTVPAGMGFSGAGTISDLVICQGTIGATSYGVLNLTNGLILSGSGASTCTMGISP